MYVKKKWNSILTEKVYIKLLGNLDLNFNFIIFWMEEKLAVMTVEIHRTAIKIRIIDMVHVVCKIWEMKWEIVFRSPLHIAYKYVYIWQGASLRQQLIFHNSA